MKILVAEDDIYTRKALETVFAAEGWTVKACPDGKSAWDQFGAFAPDFVCLDIMMPGLSGYEVCKRIRGAGSGVPVLFISAKSEEIDKVLGLELGADDFIVKPFGAREVTARVRAILRRTQAGEAAPALPEEWDFGTWRIKSRELRAYQGSAMVELSPREVKILGLLFQRRGQVVTREDFFKHCWDLSSAPQSRTLDQHMAQLRKKIEPPGDEPQLIKTVQGAGYRYEG